MTIGKAVPLVLLALGLACGAGAQTYPQIQQVASKSIYVAHAVDAYVAKSRARQYESSAQILTESTKFDKQMLIAVQSYFITVKVDWPNSAVLICTRDRERAIVEDAGCSARVDWFATPMEPSRPCTFALDLKQVCIRR